MCSFPILNAPRGWPFSRTLRLFAIVFAVAVAEPVTASAVMSTLTIDPTRSLGTFSGSASVDFGFEEGPSVAPVQSQLDFPTLGAMGGVIGDGSTSDGLTTSMTGTIDIDQSGDFLEIVGSEILPDIAGTFMPGPYQGSGPDASQHAATFDFVDLGLSGEFAIRFSAIELIASVLETSVLGDTLQLGVGSIGSIRHSAGFLIFQTDIGGFNEQGERILATNFGVTTLEGGQLVETSPGLGELTLPFTVDLSFSPAELGVGIPLRLDFQIAGTLVATGAIEPIPEPGTALLLALGLGGLSRFDRRRTIRGSGKIQ